MGCHCCWFSLCVRGGHFAWKIWKTRKLPGIQKTTKKPKKPGKCLETFFYLFYSGTIVLVKVSDENILLRNVRQCQWKSGNVSEIDSCFSEASLTVSEINKLWYSGKIVFNDLFLLSIEHFIVIYTNISRES